MWYHGATRPRHIWSLDDICKGNAEHGPGFYFTTDQKVAVKYAAPDKNKPNLDYPDGGFLHKCDLLLDEEVYGNIALIQCPRWDDSPEDFYGEKLAELIKIAPEFDSNMEDWAEGPMEGLAVSTRSLFSNSSPFEAILSVWADHYKDHPKEWAQQVVAIFEWDGALIPEKNFAVIWNPEVIVCRNKVPYLETLTPSEKE